MSARARAAVVLATAAASWPTWRWYAARLADGSDEKWGLLAVAAVAVLAVVRRAGRVAPPLGVLLALLFSSALPLPPLVRAIPALLAVGLVASALAFGRRLHAGTCALLLLALPLEATLQFFAGYPMRVAATRIAVVLLRLVAIPVTADGTLLVWRGEAIGVDAACSGVHMLWVALFLAALVGAARDFPPLRLAAGLGAAAVVVTLANGARVAVLFVKEAGLVHAPAWAHEAIGLAVFAGAASLLLSWLSRLVSATPAVEHEPTPSRVGVPAYVLCCLAAAALGFLPRDTVRAERNDVAAWPAELDGAPLVPVPLQPADEAFARSFPGRLARFSDGERAVLVRWVPRPTRQLHPAADCFRGSGYAVEPRPARVDGRGRRWSCFAAARGASRYEVCERIFDDQGGQWTDASSWWWAATLSSRPGPWWAVTVVEPRA